MTLKNLLRIGQLIEHQPDGEEIARLLEAASRAARDSRSEAVSLETRFDAAYRAIMQSATAALWAQGYRTSTSTPGHHRTTLQALTLTVGLAAQHVAILERLRHKRNQIDYTGEDIDARSVETCSDEADRLIESVRAWINHKYPNLL